MKDRAVPAQLGEAARGPELAAQAIRHVTAHRLISTSAELVHAGNGQLSHGAGETPRKRRAKELKASKSSKNMQEQVAGTPRGTCGTCTRDRSCVYRDFFQQAFEAW